MNISVNRTGSKDVDSVNITVTFKSGGFTNSVDGHINNRTNFVHLSANDDKQAKELSYWGIDLDDIAIQIENRDIDID